MSEVRQEGYADPVRRRPWSGGPRIRSGNLDSTQGWQAAGGAGLGGDSPQDSEPEVAGSEDPGPEAGADRCRRDR